MVGVFVGVPTYGESLDSGTARGLWCWATNRDDIRIMTGTRGSSLIPASCNVLLCNALNARDEANLTWFAMLHADIEPEHFWLDKLISEAERVDADMLSVVVPIKDNRGITSTAIANYDSMKDGQFCRITQRQATHPDFPKTFDIYDAANALEQLPDGLRITSVPRIGLRLNTGCMVVRIDRPWFDTDPMTVYFENLDWIDWHNGQRRQRDMSEDWRFSQRIQEAGGKLFATTTVKVVHKGLAGFPNDVAWGDCPNDAALRGAA